jgi:hypothetical protein
VRWREEVSRRRANARAERQYDLKVVIQTEESRKARGRLASPEREYPHAFVEPRRLRDVRAEAERTLEFTRSVHRRYVLR